jgi:hypothetical protein
MIKSNDFGKYMHLHEDIIVKEKAHFLFPEKDDHMSIVDCHAESDFCWNIHYSIDEFGNMVRIDLCLAFLKDVFKPHPTYKLR